MDNENNGNNYNFKSISDILRDTQDIYTDYKNEIDIYNSNVITNYEI